MDNLTRTKVPVQVIDQMQIAHSFLHAVPELFRSTIVGSAVCVVPRLNIK